MASWRRAPLLSMLTRVMAALACARIAAGFSRGDLVLSTWGGKTFSTASLRLVVLLCIRELR